MSYERISEISYELILASKQYSYIRDSIFKRLEPPKNNVAILKGARGIGKSTVIQQFLAHQIEKNHKVIYVSADSTLLTFSLAELAHQYYKRGGEYLAIDEIHKYENWQAEIKTIIDSFPSLKIIASGSSSINLDYAAADLSRRHIMIYSKGLSFREYLNKKFNLNITTYDIDNIATNATEIVFRITSTARKNKIDIINNFQEYLRSGYFLTKENYNTETLYYDSLINSINGVIDSDIAAVHKEIDNISRQKIKLLLRQIATKCPFTPNISELSRNLGIANDNILKKYLYYLSEGEILTNLYSSNKSHKDFQKPQKIFLNNSNFAYAYSTDPLIGTIRETFCANCLSTCGEITAPKFGDFCLNNLYTFEVGGKNKNRKQIKDIDNSYVLADNILSAEKGIIPLWLIGFLW